MNQFPITSVIESQRQHDRPNLAAWTPLVLSVALVLPTLSNWLYFDQLAGTAAMMPAFALGKIVQFALPIVWIALVERRRPLGLFARHGLAFGLTLGLLAGGAIVAGYGLLFSAQPEFLSAAAKVREKLAGAGFATPPAFAVMAVFYTLGHSFLEEYYWRWFVFGQLRGRVPVYAAYSLAALGFAAHHVLIVRAYFPEHTAWIVLLSGGVALGGVFWCWLYQRTGSLLGPWLSHACIDTALMAVGYMMLFT